MKQIILLVLFVSSVIIYSCYGGYYDNDEQAVAYGREKTKRDLKLAFESGKDEFFQKLFRESKRDFDGVQRWGKYIDSVKNFYNTNLKFAFQNGEYEWAGTIIAEYNLYNQELHYLYDSAVAINKEIKQKVQDSLIAERERIKKEKEMSERKWVYIGRYYDEDKYGRQSYYAFSTYYDENHLLYEGDTVCVMLKVGIGEYTYRYVSINLITKVVHGIDASTYGESYNYIWDGDWWRDPNSDFSKVLYNAVKK